MMRNGFSGPNRIMAAAAAAAAAQGSGARRPRLTTTANPTQSDDSWSAADLSFHSPESNTSQDINSTLHVTTQYDSMANESSADEHVVWNGSFESTPLGVAVAVPVTVVVASCMIYMTIALDRRLHQMCYYYYLSLAALNSLMAITVLPAAVYVVTSGFFSFSDAACKLWISGDLFFCNNVCLHMAFINMDAFLRLRDPRHRRGRRVVTACSLMLWLGAPWSVSTVQSVAQYLLSQADHESRSPRNGLCFIADKNFVVLGALFSFFVPVSVATVFAILCHAEVRMVERRLYCVTQQVISGGHVFVTSPFTDHQPEVDQCDMVSDDALSVETSAGSVISGDSPLHGATSHQLHQSSSLTQLASDIDEEVFRLDDVEQLRTSYETHQHLDRDGQQTTSFCGDLRHCQAAVDQLSAELEFAKCSPSRLTAAVNYSAHAIQPHHQSNEDEDLKRKLVINPEDSVLLGTSAADETSTDAARVISTAGVPSSAIVDEGLRQELDLFRTTRILLVSTVLLWLPVTVSNIVYATCESCRSGMTVSEVMTVKWLAYVSPLVATMVSVLCSEVLRQAMWSGIRRCFCGIVNGAGRFCGVIRREG